MAADPDDPLTRAFKYRFPFADNHTLGNLMLSALEDATGEFPQADQHLRALARRAWTCVPFNARPRVVGRRARATGAISRARRLPAIRVRRLHTCSCAVSGKIQAYRPALDAIREADLIVLGPGRLFTSIIPNLLVPGVVDAIRQSKGATLFVCSLADMQGETWGLTAREHCRGAARARHARAA